jgi:hypothetical protein
MAVTGVSSACDGVADAWALLVGTGARHGSHGPSLVEWAEMWSSGPTCVFHFFLFFLFLFYFPNSKV